MAEPVDSLPSPGFRQLPSLTGLRFIAAFAVFGFHVTAAHLCPPTAAVPATLAVLFRQGATGVSFFFILSGFVLCWSARPTDTARRFWWRRAAKIYPNHLVTALLAVALAVAVGAVSVWAVVDNLPLLQAWVPDQSIYFGLNTPSWSLSCEAFFYLCFPLILWVVDRVPARGLWPGTIALLAAVCAMPALALALPAGLRYWFVYVFPPVRILEFVVGVLLARIVRAGRWIGLGVVPAAGLAVAAYLGSGYLPAGFSYVAGTVAPLALLIPAVAVTDLRGSRSFLRTRTAVWLGEVSFAFYLVHQLAIRIGYRALGARTRPAPEGLLATVGILLTALAASAVLYRFVERPTMARLAGRRAVPAPPPAVPPRPSTA